jgi:hypothetical protein
MLIATISVSNRQATSSTLALGTFDPNFKPKFEPSIMDHYRPPEEKYRAMTPMEGVRIRVRAADGEHQAAVDGSGTWNVEGLPAGPYEISVELPKNLLLFPSAGMREELSPKGMLPR